ncbi:hypothetical protein BTVI_106533 [Pitangus sulphuratus]|nr:hypothetical protein BTVI_106533 [Pitangus sulphuratus]
MGSRKKLTRHGEQLDLANWDFTTLVFHLEEVQTDLALTGQDGTFFFGEVDSEGKFGKGKRASLFLIPGRPYQEDDPQQYLGKNMFGTIYGTRRVASLRAEAPQM